MFRVRRPILIFTASGAAGVGAAWYLLTSGPSPHPPHAQRLAPPAPWTPPSRAQHLAALKLSSKNAGEKFDLLIVGGGATGAGVALDAAARGLKVALVERDDFSSGTSSKSTKLVHGGVRYLEKAFWELDYEQYKLVREALHERKVFLDTAPYLSDMLPIMLPLYQWWKLPYYYAGCKAYDLLAGHQNISSSYVMSKTKALEAFPMLKSDGLVGAVVYYDGQHNDARMNVALIMTAVKKGAVVANHVEVTDLLKDEKGKLYGTHVRDNLTGEEWDVHAKGVINATGPFSDALLSLDDPNHKPMVQAAAGVHVTFPNYYSPRKMGLIDPATSDGRVIFFLPWQGNTIAGTTDSPSEVEREPKPREEEVRWILDEVRRYLSPDIKVRRGDVLSAWSGLRPLVRNPNATSTQGLVRSHLIHTSDSGLLTIAGGKWTTYRAMAEETVDAAVKEFGLEASAAGGLEVGQGHTKSVKLVGSDNWGGNMFIGLIQRYGLETDVAKHLSESYGDRAWTVCEYAEETGERWPQHGIRLAKMYPYIEAEVRYAVHHEYALTAVDFISRRSRLSFLNAQAALDAIPRVVSIMGDELNWSSARRAAETARAEKHLESMGLPPPSNDSTPASPRTWTQWAKGVVLGLGKPSTDSLRRGGYSRSMFAPGELDALKNAFNIRAIDYLGPDGAEKRIARSAVREIVAGDTALIGYESTREEDLERLLKGRGDEPLDYEEFLSICANLKEVEFTLPKRSGAERRRIPVGRSGGGV